MTTHILIADSSSLTVIGAETLLKGRADTSISRCENASKLIHLTTNLQPDIILLGDRFDPLIDTTALAEQLLAVASTTRVIVMGMLNDGLLIRDLFTIGAAGYLTTGDDLSVCLLTAVETTLRNRPYLSPTANSEYLLAIHGGHPIWKMDSEARSVLRLLASGCTAGEIAARMRVTRRRVYWVTEKMRAWFGAATNEHLISRAAIEGFTGFPD